MRSKKNIYVYMIWSWRVSLAMNTLLNFCSKNVIIICDRTRYASTSACELRACGWRSRVRGRSSYWINTITRNHINFLNCLIAFKLRVRFTLPSHRAFRIMNSRRQQSKKYSVEKIWYTAYRNTNFEMHLRYTQFFYILLQHYFLFYHQLIYFINLFYINFADKLCLQI